MNTEDLYKEERCPKCGQNKLKNASFCPHCGYVIKRTWLDSLRETFSGSGGGEATGAKRGTGISTLLGLAFAGYLLYSAIVEGSVQSMILAALILFTVLQSWFMARKRTQKSREESAEGIGEVREAEAGPLDDKFYCENCGTQVGADSLQCSNCGMKFGQG